MEAFAIISASHAAELLNADTPAFQALDCQAMVVNSVRSIPKGCLNKSQTPKTPEPQGTRTVGLYKAIKSITATHCSVTESRLILHCGMFSHNSAIAPIQIARPKHVNKDACKKIKNEGIFRDKRGRMHQVNKLGTTFINYVEIGELVYSHHQARCIGGKVQIDNEAVEGAMVLADIKVTVKEEVTNINPDGNLMIPEMHLFIPKRMIRDDAVSLGSFSQASMAQRQSVPIDCSGMSMSMTKKLQETIPSSTMMPTSSSSWAWGVSDSTETATRAYGGRPT